MSNCVASSHPIKYVFAKSKWTINFLHLHFSCFLNAMKHDLVCKSLPIKSQTTFCHPQNDEIKKIVKSISSECIEKRKRIVWKKLKSSIKLIVIDKRAIELVKSVFYCSQQNFSLFLLSKNILCDLMIWWSFGWVSTSCILFSHISYMSHTFNICQRQMICDFSLFSRYDKKSFRFISWI